MITTAPRRYSTLCAVAFICFIFIGACSVLVVFLSLLPTHESLGALQDKPRLVLQRSKTFTLVVFSDLHFGEEESGWGINQDINSTRVMRSVLSNESPDLVILNGDLITGENTFRENSSDYVHQIVAPLVDHQVPWASTYGNHDSKFNLSRESLYSAETSYRLAYTQQMDNSLPGITNYYLLVYSSSGNPAALLWFFDSRGGASYQREPANEDDNPNWVAPETVAWFKSTVNDLRARYGALPSIAFVHIPPQTFLSAQKRGIDPSRFPGVNDDAPVAFQGEGLEDKPFVTALLADEGLHSIYVGHDHGNAWCSSWPEDGTIRPRGPGVARTTAPFLCFSKHSGYGGYGRWKRGARVIRLSFNDRNNDGVFIAQGKMDVQTWVRMENGNMVTRVTLNDTYGLDVYPTPNGE